MQVVMTNATEGYKVVGQIGPTFDMMYLVVQFENSWISLVPLAIIPFAGHATVSVSS